MLTEFLRKIEQEREQKEIAEACFTGVTSEPVIQLQHQEIKPSILVN